MELSDIHIFLSVVEHGSVSRAAEQLGYVQSNVTARIRTLEQELGHPLFHRHRRGMILNAEGRKLLTYAERMSALMSEMHKAFQHPDDPVGSLLIGSVETVVGLPDILSKFHREYSKVDLSLVTGVTEKLTEEVLEHKLDGAFVTGPVLSLHVEQYPVFEEELVLVSGNFAEQEVEDAKPDVSDLLQQPLLVFRTGCGYRAKLQQWLQVERISPSRIMEFGTLETIIGTVAAGLGITVVPRSAVKKLEAEGMLRVYAVPAPFRHISVVYIRRADTYLSEVERKFLETIAHIRAQRMPIVHD
ncbi:LysR family transcriptional regulator [Paenibacillus sp. 481]|uniref:LysR family transcriptional regulator n=1 Tax=Paenibacillus sp. 481 TaxID=2835869 RepID=UPI001E3A7E09|nr:LysR family transcriptional regulator [Paenibacillus sp. 481]UHA72277.1 LysR family transcriptional regulator [Paenibacillus sp. 481]